MVENRRSILNASSFLAKNTTKIITIMAGDGKRNIKKNKEELWKIGEFKIFVIQ